MKWRGQHRKMEAPCVLIYKWPSLCQRQLPYLSVQSDGQHYLFAFLLSLPIVLSVVVFSIDGCITQVGTDLSSVCQIWTLKRQAFHSPPYGFMPPVGQQPGPPHTTAEILYCHQMNPAEAWKEDTVGLCCVERANASPRPKRGIFHDTVIEPSSSFPTICSGPLLIYGLRCRVSSFLWAGLKFPFVQSLRFWSLSRLPPL